MSVPDGGQELHETVQLLMAGHRVDAAIYALAHSLAGTIAFAADSQEHARAILASLQTDMARTISDNWASLEEQKAGCIRQAGSA